MALRDYIPTHIYNSASAHLFGPEELKQSPTGPQLRPEYATLRAYAAGNIEVFSSLSASLHCRLLAFALFRSYDDRCCCLVMACRRQSRENGNARHCPSVYARCPHVDRTE